MTSPTLLVPLSHHPHYCNGGGRQQPRKRGREQRKLPISGKTTVFRLLQRFSAFKAPFSIVKVMKYSQIIQVLALSTFLIMFFTAIPRIHGFRVPICCCRYRWRSQRLYSNDGTSSPPTTPSADISFSSSSNDHHDNGADTDESSDSYIPIAERSWTVKPVGYVESPYVKRFGTPKQATISRHEGGAQAGRIILLPGFEECIEKMDGFDFIWVLSFMHRNSGYKTQIKPMPRADALNKTTNSNDLKVGLFCSRAPHRPNPIALSALKVTGVDTVKGIIDVIGLDLLDGTPILDIKPYVPAFDAFPDARAGWMDDIDGGDYIR